MAIAQSHPMAISCYGGLPISVIVKRSGLGVVGRGFDAELGGVSESWLTLGPREACGTPCTEGLAGCQAAARLSQDRRGSQGSSN